MKRRDLEKKLVELGWYFERNGSNHDIWTNGKELEPLPRHNEINEYLARKFLRRARKST